MPDELFLNGVNGATGAYLLPSLGADQLSRVARGMALDADEQAELRSAHRRATEKSLALPFGTDP